MASERQQIITALLTRLGTIKVADGYRTDAGFNISEWRSNYDQVEVTELPAISIYDTDDQWVPESYGQHRFLHTLSVTIEGLAVGNTGPANARKLIEDIHAAINTDRTFGALVREVEPKSDRMMVREAERILIACQCSFDFKYETTNYET